jgi:AraC-like DNA-binding protein
MSPDTRKDPKKSIPAPAGYVRFVLKRFGTTDELRAGLVAGTDIDEERLNRPGAEVTLFTFVTLSENLTRQVGESWPLDSLAAWGTAMQGALEAAVRSAPTVGDGLDVIARFGHVRAPFMRIGIKHDAAALRLVCQGAVEIEPATWRSLSLAAMLGVTSMLEPLLEGRMGEIEVRYPWPRPDYVSRVREAFATDVRFSQQEFCLSVPLALCAEISPFADPGLHAVALADLESAARRIHASNQLLLKLQSLMARQRNTRLSEDEAARELGLSRRTLVRRLSAGGTSFRQMLDAELKARARAMLDEGRLSRTQMAKALGFEDPTSFSRSCRRWFGDEQG